jgi:transcription antitermination factor NusG
LNGIASPLIETATPAKVDEVRLLANLQKKWFAVFTRSHHEKRVAQYYSEKGIEHFLPLYRTTHQWTHYRKAILDLPLFSNYLFVHIASQERIRVLSVPGVVALVGQGNTPTPLADSEVESLRSGLHLRKFEPYPYLVEGAKVRIKTGALAGIQGVVLRKKNSLRVIFSMDLLMRSIAVEVDADELEPVDLRS